METKEYTVTDRAGPKVAGRPAKKGDTLQLTERQAEAELLAHAIVPKGQELKLSEPSKRLEGIQARAKGFDTPEEAEQAEQTPAGAPPLDPGKGTEPDKGAESGKGAGRKPAAA